MDLMPDASVRAGVGWGGTFDNLPQSIIHELFQVFFEHYYATVAIIMIHA